MATSAKPPGDGAQPPSGAPRTRRAPAPGERQQDADRSRRLLLAAALDEFAAKGFAGARVQEIAARAGVNKQLINYYFDSKEGLYLELQRSWLCREQTFADPDLPLADLAARYL
ncbi:MAG TPA: helix-turn-helix domain-containing protein, partial [Pseudonocardiaceae bacterium]|nr:helix-turn-helix domain-containing protein [Pseudonocardiaceae bacterium]